MPTRIEDIVQVDGALWVATMAVRSATYDFDFADYFPCRHAVMQPPSGPGILRVGALEDLDKQYYDSIESLGITPINTLEDHRRAAELPRWYPLLEGITPSSILFEPGTPPDVSRIERELGWPVFLRGGLHTRKHRRTFWRVESPAHLQDVWREWCTDSFLSTQILVVRKFIPFCIVADPMPNRIPAAFEFRTFWLHGECVALGPYWPGIEPPYAADAADRAAILALAGEACRRLQVPFVVIDVAKDIHDNWWVIECNDGQDSGMAGLNPLVVWHGIVDRQKRWIKFGASSGSSQ